jgi:hypothetical protein
MLKPMTRLPVILLAVLAALVAVPAAFAQQAPPVPKVNSTAAPWIGYAVMFLMLLLVLGISLLPSKRSHQD